jgi:hypothetical protein
MSDALRSLVASERQRRGYMSGRAASTAAQEAGARISYTTWNEWETGKRDLGDSMRRAVMVLFGWPYDWPEHPPEADSSSAAEVSQLRAEVARLARAVDQIADVLGVTLDAGLPPHSTDVDPPDDVGQPPSS